MKRARPRRAAMAGGILGGGIAAGLLLSLAVPTTMKGHVGQGWRDLIPVSAAAAAEETSSYWIEAPPQDLTPVNWQTDPSSGGMQLADDGWTPYVDEPSYADTDYGYSGMTNAELMFDPRTGPTFQLVSADRSDLPRTVADQRGASVLTDAAAAAAEAARIAAAAVRTEIAAASAAEPDTTIEADDFERAFGVE